MEVLKDASATAIYGSRASNGVVLITTRQGEEGKTKVSHEGYYALQQLPKKLETLTLPNMQFNSTSAPPPSASVHAKKIKDPQSSAAVPTGRMKSSAPPRCTTIR